MNEIHNGICLILMENLRKLTLFSLIFYAYNGFELNDFLADVKTPFIKEQLNEFISVGCHSI